MTNKYRPLLVAILTNAVFSEVAMGYKIAHPILGGACQIGEPVHETILYDTLSRAKKLNTQCLKKSLDKKEIKNENLYQSIQMWDYLRGVFWNDDPQCILFKKSPPPEVVQSHNVNDDFTSYDTELTCYTDSAYSRKQSSGIIGGIPWWFRYKGIKKDTIYISTKYLSELEKIEKAPKSSLTRESHYGRLQFLHAMRNGDETAEQTQKMILAWANFTLQIWRGAIKGEMLLVDLKSTYPDFEPIADIIKAHLGDHATVSTLFCIDEKGGDLRKRAAGSLLHMVQDSYAKEHTIRSVDDSIIEFSDYGQQKAEVHAKSDSFRNCKQEKLRKGEIEKECADAFGCEMRLFAERTCNGDKAIKSGETLLGLMKNKTMAKMLDGVASIFRLAKSDQEATKGENEAKLPAIKLAIIKDEIAHAKVLKNNQDTAALDDIAARLMKKGTNPGALSLGSAIGQQTIKNEDYQVEQRSDGGLYIILPENIFFDSNQDDLAKTKDPKKRQEAIENLDGIADAIKQSGILILLKNSKRKILINGHTDSKSPTGNWSLSSRRALSVTKFLIGRGIPEELLVASGYSYFMPRVPDNGTEANRAINRRVEIVIQPDVEKLTISLNTYKAIYEKILALMKSE